jgi:hypothetical protein
VAVQRNERGGANLDGFEPSARGVLTSEDLKRMREQERRDAEANLQCRTRAARAKIDAFTLRQIEGKPRRAAVCEVCNDAGTFNAYDAQGNYVAQIECPECSGSIFNGSTDDQSAVCDP